MRPHVGVLAFDKRDAVAQSWMTWVTSNATTWTTGATPTRMEELR